MTPQDSADLGARAAQLMRIPITQSMKIPGLSRVHWWGGFLATLAGFCHNDVGAEANSILQAVTAQALKQVTKGTEH